MTHHLQLSNVFNQIKKLILGDLENMEFNLRTEKNLHGTVYVTKEYSFFGSELIISQMKDPYDNSGDIYQINGIFLEGQWGPHLISFIETEYDREYGYKDNPHVAKDLSLIINLISSKKPDEDIS